jgi:hypothetical protein
MKKLYDKNLVSNLYSNNYPPYNALLEYLEGDDFEQKHFALTFISSLENSSDINLFIANIVDQDTKIRELASFRLNDLIVDDISLMEFLDKRPDIVLRTICDVNPQVCRNICSLLPLSQNKPYLIEQVLNKIDELAEKTQTIRAKTHKVSKDIFNLYWNFFALENLLDKDFKYSEKLEQIISICLKYKDYTIREKAACAAKKLLQEGFSVSPDIIEKIQTDENFYVRKTFLD